MTGPPRGGAEPCRPTPTGEPGAPTRKGNPLSRLTLAALAVPAALLLPVTVPGVAEAAPTATAGTHTPAKPALTAAQRARLHRLHLAHLHRLHVHHLRTLANLAHARAAGTARARVVKAARSYIGTPYVNGGMSRAGTDCSGLVDLAYKAIGKRLPRTTQALARTGRNVTGHARVGDVLVYQGAGHVAIVAAVSRGRVTNTLVARHSGTRVQYQKPYAAYTVRSVLA